MDAQDLNKCLRGEIAAAETYRQALEKNRAQYGNDPKFRQLTQMLQDHENAASELRSLIRRMGGKESTGSGAWGSWSKTVMGTAKLFGDKAALKALKEGEESGVKDYNDMLGEPTVPSEVKSTLQPIISREQQHIRELDRLMEVA